MTWNNQELDIVFGPGEGDLPEQRARACDREYLRSLDQLTEYRGRGTGRRLTAAEALQAYGFETLREIATEGSAPLCHSSHAAGRVLRDRRNELGLSTRNVANQAKVDLAHVEAAEESKRLPLRIYERIARVLALDERYVSVRSEPTENERVTLRLRTVGREMPTMTPSLVATLAEAAWVASRQVALEDRLALRPEPTGIEPNPSYGTSSLPAYRWGYHLAGDARQHLGLGSEPIESLRALSEERLGFPVIQTELGDRIGGATLEIGTRRALVVNVSGGNRHAYIRRSTLAHEIGHLLYDPSTQLNTLRVDEYEALEARPERVPDPIEQRANAFSVEFLAPQAAAIELFHQGGEDPLARVMHVFGISFTAARYHVWNGLERSVPFDSLTTDDVRAREDWEGREAFTVDYHPVRRIRPSRAGRFSALVMRAAQERIVSLDTAAEWLEADGQDMKRASAQLPDLYPSVFSRR